MSNIIKPVHIQTKNGKPIRLGIILSTGKQSWEKKISVESAVLNIK
jgi:hypothetical protein